MSDSDEPETKRQKLQTTRASQLNAESRMCFVRHFAKCYKKKSIPIELEKRENLLKVTLLSKSTIYVIRSLLRKCWVQNKIGNEFELQLDQGTGTKFRFKDNIMFVFLQLVCPFDFRICGHFGDIHNYSRIDKLIHLSKSATELVAFKPTHEDNFVLLLQSMRRHLNYLECDSKFLAFEDVPNLRIKHFKSSSSREQVPLRDILRHLINLLDMRNDLFGDCIADDECRTQNALHTLMVKGSMNSTHESLNYLEDVKVFAPKLKSYEIDFDDEISSDEIELVAPNFSQHIWRKFLSLTDLASKFENHIDSLTIRAIVKARMKLKMKYETDWISNIQKLANLKMTIESTPDHRTETVEIEKNEGFFKLCFKVKLMSFSTIEWNNDMLFERLHPQI